MTEHRWAEVIRAWANGQPIQSRRFDDVKWRDFDDEEGYTPAFNWDALEWRIKPAYRYIEYRLALIRDPESNQPKVLLVDDDLENDFSEGFIQWLTPPQVICFDDDALVSDGVEGPLDL